MDKIIKPIQKISGRFTVPGDKSISHRSVMLGAVSTGTTRVTGFLTGDDCRSTIACFRQLGIEIEENGTTVTVHGKGLRGLTKPGATLDVGNSGTTLRLLTGLLAPQNFSCEITGDSSIQKRPMKRVILPLSQMGASISGKGEGGYAPLVISGRPLKGIQYAMPIASAQVKSAILLAGLYADGDTIIDEGAPTRNHTEIMLRALGADITRENGKIIMKPTERLLAKDIAVPGDISSAAFLIVAALLLPGSEITIENVNTNPTRTGILTALRQMGADISIVNERNAAGEPTGDIVARHSKLHGTKISGALIPRMIDEIPIFAVAASFAQGQTVVADAQELMVKESNRIKSVHDELSKMGASITETADGMVIDGGNRLSGAAESLDSHNDHRIAMSLAIAALCANGESRLQGVECVDISFPRFFEIQGLFA